jgi:hypothetical protein
LDQPEEQDGGHDDHQDGGVHDDEMSGPHPPKRLRANAASCDNKLMCIMTHLGAPANNTVGYQALNSIIAEFIATTLHPTSLHELVKSSLGSVSHNQAGYNSYHRVLDDHLSGLTSRAYHDLLHSNRRRHISYRKCQMRDRILDPCRGASILKAKQANPPVHTCDGGEGRKIGSLKLIQTLITLDIRLETDGFGK